MVVDVIGGHDLEDGDAIQIGHVVFQVNVVQAREALRMSSLV
jgi:hypothetical protein